MSDLEWLVANHASFGHSISSVVDDDGGADDVDTIFCRVPCRHQYEWHCYDGATWREALANARAAGSCDETVYGCSKGTAFSEGERHPLEIEVRQLRAQLAAALRDNAALGEPLHREITALWKAAGLNPRGRTGSWIADLHDVAIVVEAYRQELDRSIGSSLPERTSAQPEETNNG